MRRAPSWLRAEIFEPAGAQCLTVGDDDRSGLPRAGSKVPIPRHVPTPGGTRAARARAPLNPNGRYGHLSGRWADDDPQDRVAGSRYPWLRVREVATHRSSRPMGGATGRILGHRAGRRMFVGVLALAGLALAACGPLKPPPEPPPPPEPGCTPICLPGQEPQQDPNAKIVQPDPEPTPDCVPICPPSDGGGQPQVNARPRAKCVRIPIPCVPGVDIPDCVNFCPPGQEPPPPQAALEPGPEV